MDADELRAWRERVAAASGPARDIDQAIHAALGLPDDAVIYEGSTSNAYTADVEAVGALVDHVLPDRTYSLDCGPNEATLKPSLWGVGDQAAVSASGGPAPLALCEAFPIALIAKAEREAKQRLKVVFARWKDPSTWSEAVLVTTLLAVIAVTLFFNRQRPSCSRLGCIRVDKLASLNSLPPMFLIYSWRARASACRLAGSSSAAGPSADAGPCSPGRLPEPGRRPRRMRSISSAC